MILSLARDESMTVRSGVLEALAEVIYTFHEDPDGPPEQLVRLFLGIREDDDPRKNEVKEEKAPSPPASPMSWSDFMASVSSGTNDGPEADIYEDPSRPLVCAFNFPAVALTLGRARWPELRQLYTTLSQSRSFKVRRTLAASLGEMAKIIGPENSHADLVPVWWSSVHAIESDIRLKALDCLDTFIGAVSEEDRGHIVSGLSEEIWPLLRGWRERESVMKALRAFASTDGVSEFALWHLLRKGLVDTAATIRETAVSTVSCL